MEFRWWIALVIAVIGTAHLMAYEQHRATAQYQAHRASYCASLGGTAKEKISCEEEKYDAKSDLPWWAILYTWPEGMTVWAIIGTGFIIAWQSHESRKAATAAAEAANAAYGTLSFMEAQFELLKEKDRAKLDLSVERNNLEVQVEGEHLLHLISTLLIRNVGESKAFIGIIRGVLVSKLGNEPLGEIEHATLDLPDRVLEPNKTPIATKAYCFPEATAPTFAECLEQGTYSLHFFGFIEYETMGLWWRKEFGYDWKIVNRNIGDMFGLSDPFPNSPKPAKDRITYGYWSPSDEKEKPEYPISKPQGES